MAGGARKRRVLSHIPEDMHECHSLGNHIDITTNNRLVLALVIFLAVVPGVGLLRALLGHLLFQLPPPLLDDGNQLALVFVVRVHFFEQLEVVLAKAPRRLPYFAMMVPRPRYLLKGTAKTAAPR